MTKSPGNSDTKDSSGRSRRNKQKRRINGDNAEDTAVNAGFRGSKSGQRKKPFKRNTPSPSNLDRILDRSCQIHGTPEKPANHTNRDCWVFKQAGKLNAENEDKGLHSDDDEEPRPPNNSGQKGFPPTSADGEHDIRNPRPQKGAEARVKGRIRGRASRPKVQPTVLLPDHL